MPVQFYEYVDRETKESSVFAIQINPERPDVAVVSEIAENKGQHVSQLRDFLAACLTHLFERPVQEVRFYQQDVAAGTIGRWILPSWETKPEESRADSPVESRQEARQESPQVLPSASPQALPRESTAESRETDSNEATDRTSGQGSRPSTESGPYPASDRSAEQIELWPQGTRIRARNAQRSSEAEPQLPTPEPVLVEVSREEVEEFIGEPIDVPPLRVTPLKEAGVEELYYAQRIFMDSAGRSVTCHLRLYQEQPEGGEGITAQPVLIVTQHPKSESVGGIADQKVQHEILTEMESRFAKYRVDPLDLVYIACWPEGSREEANGYGRNAHEYYEERAVLQDRGQYGTQRSADAPIGVDGLYLSRTQVQAKIGDHNLDVPEIRREPVILQIEIDPEMLAREIREAREEARVERLLNDLLTRAQFDYYSLPRIDRAAFRTALERGEIEIPGFADLPEAIRSSGPQQTSQQTSHQTSHQTSATKEHPSAAAAAAAAAAERENQRTYDSFAQDP